MNKDLMSKAFGIKKHFLWCFNIKVVERGCGYEVICSMNILGKILSIPFAIIEGIVAGIISACENIKDGLATPVKSEYCDCDYNTPLYDEVKKYKEKG